MRVYATTTHVLPTMETLVEQFSQMEAPRSPRTQTPPQPPKIVRKSHAFPIKPKGTMTRVDRLKYVIKQLKRLSDRSAGTKELLYYIGFLLRGMYWSAVGVAPQKATEGAIDVILMEHMNNAGSGTLLQSNETKKAWKQIDRRLTVDKLDTSHWCLKSPVLSGQSEAPRREELNRKAKELVALLETEIAVARSLDASESRSLARQIRAPNARNSSRRVSKPREGVVSGAASGRSKGEEAKTQNNLYGNMLAARKLNLRF